MSYSPTFKLDIGRHRVLLGLQWAEVRASGRLPPDLVFRKELLLSRRYGALTGRDPRFVASFFDRNEAGEYRIPGAAWFAKAHEHDFQKQTFLIEALPGGQWWLVGVHRGAVIPGADHVGTLDDCVTIYRELSAIGRGFQAIDETRGNAGDDPNLVVYGPSEISGYFGREFKTGRFVDLVRNTAPIHFSTATKDLAKLFGAILLFASAIAFAWWVWEATKPPPPPAAPPPAETRMTPAEISAFNEQSLADALAAEFQRVTEEPIAGPPLVRCLDALALLGKGTQPTTPGWSLLNVRCDPAMVRIELRPESWGTFAVLPQRLTYDGIEAVLRLEMQRNQATYETPSVTPIGAGDRFIKVADWIGGPLRELQQHTAGRQVAVSVTDPKPVLVTHPGYDAEGKPTVLSGETGRASGTVRISGSDVGWYRTIAKQLTDHTATWRLTSGSLNVSSWQMELIYVVEM